MKCVYLHIMKDIITKKKVERCKWRAERRKGGGREEEGRREGEGGGEAGREGVKSKRGDTARLFVD